MSYTIEIPDVPPSLNKVLRMHWATKKKLSEKWQQEIWYQLLCVPGDDAPLFLTQFAYDKRKMRIAVTLHNARQYDKDNAYGACKVIFDAIKKLGLLHDDRAEFLEASVEQVKSTRKGKKTVIEVGPAL